MEVGLPYETASKEIAGYTLLLVRGSETGVFSPGRIEVTYVYKKNPGQVIIPQPVIPVTPVTPGSITPISPVTPGGVTPVTPEGSIPSSTATPSQINIPGDRYQDLVIRPTATPSIATSSNVSRGGSTGAGGSSTLRTDKVNTVTEGKSKSDKELILIDNATPSREPQKSDYQKETKQTTSATSATRIGLSVPKTEDTKDMRGYIFALITSLTAVIALALKKKEEI